MMEGVCLGTKAAVRGLQSAGHAAARITMAGGATKSPLWLQVPLLALSLSFSPSAAAPPLPPWFRRVCCRLCGRAALAAELRGKAAGGDGRGRL